MKSLRRSVLVWTALLLLAVGVVSALGTYFYVKGEAAGAVDTQLKQIAYFVSTSNFLQGESVPKIDTPSPEDMFMIEVWDVNGKLLRSSSNASNLPSPESSGFADLKDVQQAWRSYSLVGALSSVRVSLPADLSDEQASNAALQVAVPAGVVIPLSWLLLSLIIHRIFAPLDLAAGRLRQQNSNLTAPIAEDEYPREVAPFIVAINDLVSRLQGNIEQQKQFVSNAAHELRTPLTAIALQIDNLRRFAKTGELKKRVGALEAGSKRANQLVNKLLLLAHLDGNAAPLQDERADIGSIIDSVVEGIAPLAAQRRVSLRFGKTAGRLIIVPKSQARSIIEALVENAVLYTNAGGKVEIELKEQGTSFQVQVKDSGIGIDADKMPHVFDRFYRAAPASAEGTGLGLAIAKATAEGLGWSLSVGNRLDARGVIATVTGRSSGP